MTTKNDEVVEVSAPVLKQKDITDRSRAQSSMALKRKVRMFYDLQQMRMATGGRTRVAAKDSKMPPIDLHPVDIAVLERRSLDLHTAEKGALGDVEEHLKTIPFYRQVLSQKDKFKGIGPTMAGVILSEINIERCETPSQMFSYAGIAPVSAMRCTQCHRLVELEEGEGYYHVKTKARPGPAGEAKQPLIQCTLEEPMTDETAYPSGKSARPTKGEKLKYNAFLRTRLLGVLGPVLLQVNSPWRRFYDNYKQRKLQAGWGMSDGHRHNAAIRYMIKMLLQELWIQWRTFEGLPTRVSYQEQYLGHKHEDTRTPLELLNEKEHEFWGPMNSAAAIAAEVAAAS